MAEPDEGLKILASSSSAQRISRRAFMSGSVVAAFSGGFLLSACSKGSSTTNAATGAGGSSGATTPVLEDNLNFYHWATYDDPKIFKRFTQELGPATQLDYYSSNEELITKLVAAAGSSGYDIVVPTGPYIPQMVANNLLQELDLSKIPNFKNLETVFTNQPWDPGNKHSVCKDWGTVGWIVDKSQISRPINTWSDFIDVAMNEASGNVSLLDAQNEVYGVYFWANGIDWTTTSTADLDAYEAWALEFAPHVKAFDSYPGYSFAEGNYALSHAWNGDARQGFNSFEDPSRYAWGLGAPNTELWMDNWTIVQGAPHPEAAYAFINFILDPGNSLQDMAYHGYNTGITGVKEAAEAAGLPFLDMIFLTDAQLATMHAQEINSAFDREVEIFLKMKAAAGG
ncbi:MAG: spermidine/putrescine ABC transporter substrate-binding protein [Actinomycetota bacterium]|nr:spermidine/putrescine ABC transporter substrate-binding protein [Actinomycetota bacterium]